MLLHQLDALLWFSSSTTLLSRRLSVTPLVLNVSISLIVSISLLSTCLKYFSLKSVLMNFRENISFVSLLWLGFWSSSLTISTGPKRQRITGSMMRPWKRPKRQIMRNILKNEMKTCDLEVTRRDRANIVEKPPLTTAGAIFSIINRILAFLVPGVVRKPWTMWAQ